MTLHIRGVCGELVVHDFPGHLRVILIKLELEGQRVGLGANVVLATLANTTRIITNILDQVCRIRCQ